MPFRVAQGSNWEWNQDTKRYRDTNTGRIITSNSRIGLRDDLIENHLPEVRRLARGLRDGKVSVQGFVSSMRRIIKNSYLQQWALQRGGLNAMTSNDLITLSLHTQRQHEFSTKVCRTDHAKANCHIRKSATVLKCMCIHQHSQQNGQRQAVLILTCRNTLATGNQICRARCKCRWEIKEEEELTLCYWIIDVNAEHCESCRINAAMWKPFIP